MSAATRTARARAARPKGVPPTRTRAQWRPEPLASLLAAAELITADLLAGELTSRQVRKIVRQVTERASLPADAVPGALHALVARDTRLLSSNAGEAASWQVTALRLFTPIAHASVWLIDDAEQVCVVHEGSPLPAKRRRSVVRRTIGTGELTTVEVEGTPGLLHGVPLGPREPRGALVIETMTRRTKALPFATEAAGVLTTLVERLRPSDEASLANTSLIQASDRRITRLGLDLHDGPLQDLALLVADLAYFGRQIQQLLPDEQSRRIARRRVSDLKTIARSVSDDLREIAASVGRTGVSLGDALEHSADRLRRNGTDVRLSVAGPVERTTPSQRIAVARVVEEALVNVREHSRATEVDVDVCRDSACLRVLVRDNGVGFDLARAGRRAARERRLGLVVMGERVRLLGGRLDVDTRPGGPTVVSATLPAWDAAT